MADSCSPAAFRLSLQLQPSRGTDVRKKRSSPDTRPATSHVNEPEVDSHGAATQSGDGPGREASPSYLGFSCHILSLAIAHSMVSSPTSHVCRETDHAEETGSSYEGLRARTLAIQEVAADPRCSVCEHLRRGVLSAHARWVPWYRCADKVDDPCSGHTDMIRDSESEEHWEWDLDPNLRFRFSLLYRSSRGSLCKSSFVLIVRFSLDGLLKEVTSPRHSMHPTILIFDPFTMHFHSKLGDPLPQQRNMAAWASPVHFRVHAAHRTGTKLRTVLQREDKQKCEWMIPKKEATHAQSRRRRAAQQRSQRAHTTNAQTSKNRICPAQRTRWEQHVLQRESFGPSKGFRAAALRYQTLRGSADSGHGRARGFPVGLAHTTSTTTTAATQTSVPEALQQRCSVQHKYWMELQTLRRRIQRTLDQIRDPSRQLPPRTAILEQLLST